jgi:DNA-directed RNA polymerase specialized sigma24 family protein
MTQELLVLVYKKDERAFTHIYDMYSKSLFSVINVLVSNREEAEDVLQEVLLRFGKTLILIMRVKDSTRGYLILQEILHR